MALHVLSELILKLNYRIRTISILILYTSNQSREKTNKLPKATDSKWWHTDVDSQSLTPELCTFPLC